VQAADVRLWRRMLQLGRPVFDLENALFSRARKQPADARASQSSNICRQKIAAGAVNTAVPAIAVAAVSKVRALTKRRSAQKKENHLRKELALSPIESSDFKFNGFHEEAGLVGLRPREFYLALRDDPLLAAELSAQVSIVHKGNLNPPPDVTFLNLYFCLHQANPNPSFAYALPAYQPPT
jgi:hypothetical protein